MEGYDRRYVDYDCPLLPTWLELSFLNIAGWVGGNNCCW